MVSTNQQTSSDVEGLSRKYTEVVGSMRRERFMTKRLEKLQRLSDDILSGRLSDELREEASELSQKLAENEKCRYRIGVMKRRIEELKQVGGKQANGKKIKEEKVSRKYVKVLDYGDSILECLISAFDGVVKQIFPQIDISVQLRETSNLKFGDYQFDSCPLITKKLSDLGVKMSPMEVAEKVMQNLPKLELVERIEPVKLFINIFLNPKIVGLRLASAYSKGVTVPRIEKQRVCIDFSSPNIAKQMHVGHLRSTIIGESFSRLMEFVGYDVVRINHLGDWGTQFGMLIAHLQDEFPNFASETPPIADLQAFYKESKKRFDEDEEFKARAYECVVQLQNHNPVITNAWKLICDVSRRGLLKEDEGRKIYWPTGATIPLTIVKSDGGFTYDTSDMATIRYRLFEERANWLLYVVDAGQSTHLETIFSAARDLKWYEPEKTRVEHIQFGVVLGEDKKKFKSRSGDTVRLTDLLDEGVQRAAAKLREKGRDQVMTQEELTAAQESVAYGCIRYADLSNGRVSDYVFSFDRMLDDRGNTAVYLLYAYARIQSIIRNANVEPERITEYVNQLADSILPLDHPAELKLAKQLLRLSDVLITVLESLQLHKLCDYVYTLATMFHDFYKECYVVSTQPDGSRTINFHRMVLCSVTADVMRTCFKILGIRPVEKM
ncbi:putative arginine--tRNA ligase, cytoplasmic [Aphelenchoides besseyi]|nr:putative arginine--tRNA ligase, cytoplasmic [Aphelenchoides besseyi]KAI6172530.1 putative arginine--tRNA ligase, cytoplasmic [Aphelenchoides besseyi]KAI6194907.1 putative arginine--tRNA ligase, cytoplasmic [Aphelenchoides besseyi]